MCTQLACLKQSTTWVPPSLLTIQCKIKCPKQKAFLEQKVTRFIHQRPTCEHTTGRENFKPLESRNHLTSWFPRTIRVSHGQQKTGQNRQRPIHQVMGPRYGSWTHCPPAGTPGGAPWPLPAATTTTWVTADQTNAGGGRKERQKDQCERIPPIVLQCRRNA